MRAAIAGLAFIIAMGAVVGSASASTGETTAQLMADCNKDADGCAEEITAMVMMVSTCAPSLSQAGYRDAVLGYFAQHPELANEDYEDSGTEAVNSLWPCH